MRTPLVSGHEASDIQHQVSRLLRDLDDPEPPLSLEMVRDWLELDLQYYSTDDHTFVRDVVHKLKVAGKQILRRPTLLLDAIRKASLRALWLPDRKRILIDEELPKLKHRWAEGHEIGHVLIPWHAEFLLGDSEAELSRSCYAQIEAEANFACGQLLFLQDRFVEEANSLPLKFDSVKTLKGRFGNTQTSTLWRLVEEYRGAKALVGIISVHPRRHDDEFDPDEPCRYVIESRKFRSQFTGVSEIELFRAMQGYCGWQRGGPLGTDEVVLRDDNGHDHIFRFETFFNGYEALTIGVQLRKLSTSTSKVRARPAS